MHQDTRSRKGLSGNGRKNNQDTERVKTIIMMGPVNHGFLMELSMSISSIP